MTKKSKELVRLGQNFMNKNNLIVPTGGASYPYCKEVGYWIKEKIDEKNLIKYIKMGYNIYQLKLFRKYFDEQQIFDDLFSPSVEPFLIQNLLKAYSENRVDYSAYLGEGFNLKQLCVIVTGLAKGLDVSVYADKRFSWEQMDTLMGGLEFNLDVSVCAKPEYKDFEMHLVIRGLVDGFDISDFAGKELDYSCLNNILYCLEKEKLHKDVLLGLLDIGVGPDVFAKIVANLERGKNIEDLVES